MAFTHEVDPISRIEGHLGVKLTTEASGGVQTITDAQVHGNLWRGFENFLLGREANDAITFTQRICGVCPIPHATASMFAVDGVMGHSDGYITFAEDTTSSPAKKGVPKRAVYIRNLIYISEFLMSNITHFYHLAAPSYVQGPAVPPWTPYFHADAYHDALENTNSDALPQKTLDGTYPDETWSAVILSYVKALRIRRLTFEAGAMFAGRMPMTSAFVAGGVTNEAGESLDTKCTKFRQLMEEVGRFVIQEYVPIALTLGVLYKDYDNGANGSTKAYGAGWGNFLAWGAFPDPDTDALAVKGGVYVTSVATGATYTTLGLNQFATNRTTVNAETTGAKALVAANLEEDITNSRYADYGTEFGADNRAYPGDVTRTQPDRSNGYTYFKAPRWGGNPMEVGPFARLVVNEQYPIDGTNLRDCAGLSSLYGLYVKTANSTTGLDPLMVSPDVAVGLVRDGLATLTIDDGTTQTVVDGTALNDLADASGIGAVTDAYKSANAVITGTVKDWIYDLKGGLSTMDRLRARALETLVHITLILGTPAKDTVNFTITFPDTAGTAWIDRLKAETDTDTCNLTTVPTGAVSSMGVSEAPRGALAHFCSIDGGKITAYQCVVPTTWNAAPKDSQSNHGPMEKAMVGGVVSDPVSSVTSAALPFDDTSVSVNRSAGISGSFQAVKSGYEALRVAQSFDPCIACGIH